LASDQLSPYHLEHAGNFYPNTTGFNQLPKAEQVRYLQALWHQISANPDEVPVPESHLRLAEERLRRYRENPATAKSAFEVIDVSPEIQVIRYTVEAASAVEADVEAAFDGMKARNHSLGLNFLQNFAWLMTNR
jgi:hypothetical protein